MTRPLSPPTLRQCDRCGSRWTDGSPFCPQGCAFRAPLRRRPVQFSTERATSEQLALFDRKAAA